MSTPIVDDAAQVFADPTAYTDEPRLHAALTHLRAHAPVSLVDRPPYRPFWAITKHADIMEIERANDLFINAPRPLLGTAEADDLARAQLDAGMGLRTLIHMDDPQHRVVRAIGADWFRPKAMRALKVRVDELAKIHVDKMMAAGPECDFVAGGRGQLPALRDHVAARPAGIGLSPHAQAHPGTVRRNRRRRIPARHLPEEQLQFCSTSSATSTRSPRRDESIPTEDLASAIANARIDGEPLSDVDTASYYVIIATAGHDTTSATIAGGLQALVENPDQRERLPDNLELMPLATEEMIRWVTPVKEFMRTAAAGHHVRGVPIAKGEAVYLSYVSANRDDEVFDDPFRFDVGRDPNKHLAFGYGVHFCLGAALARMEVSSFFTELLPRLNPSSWPANPNSSPPHSSAASSTCRFDTRCASPVLRTLNVQETVDGRERALAVVEIGQGGQAPQHQRADEQRDGPGSVDLTQLGGLRAVENGVERRRVLLGDAFAQCGDRRAVGGVAVTRFWQLFQVAPQRQPGHRRHDGRRLGHRFGLTPCTTATRRSRSEPSAGGVGDGGMRLLKAAASKSFPLGKWRYSVARATLAARVTASTVTALGPPDRSSAAAASSKRARDRAGRGSVLRR